MKTKYCIIAKTGSSEMRAMQNLSSDNLNKILPVVELTRGRAKNIGTKQDPMFIYPYESKISKIKEIFSSTQFALDVTSEESLSSQEIDSLFDYSNGYANWIDLIRLLKQEGFNIIPSILRNYDDDNFEENLKRQVENISSSFSEIMYRCTLDDEGITDDVKLIIEYLKSLERHCNLIIILDCGWISPASYKDAANVCISKIKELIEKTSTKEHNIIVCSTTFPNNVSEIGKDFSDVFDLREIDMYELIAKQYPKVIYGDYGSINPIRNDQIVMARGWIPRIDVALERQIYYYRERKGERSYSDTYTYVARKAVSNDKFPSSLDSWGFRQIKNCALGDAPSASPSFWISVRMNSHIIQQINRLKL